MSSEGDCPKCGAQEESRRIIPFEPRLSPDQSEKKWSANIHELHGVVCIECGLVLSLVDIRNSQEKIDPKDDETHRDSGSNPFKIDWELE